MNFVRNLIWFATLVAPAVLASFVRWVAAVALAFGFLVVRFLVWAKVVAGERIIAANRISVSRFKVFSSSRLFCLQNLSPTPILRQALVGVRPLE